MHVVIAGLRAAYADRDRFALVVGVRGAGRIVRSTLLGRAQAHATPVGAAAIAEVLYAREAVLMASHAK